MRSSVPRSMSAVTLPLKSIQAFPLRFALWRRSLLRRLRPRFTIFDYRNAVLQAVFILCSPLTTIPFLTALGRNVQIAWNYTVLCSKVQ
jgi:hypothetical protein